MRVLVATDAWRPQVNGVVRTLTSLAASAGKLGVEVVFLNPEGFASMPVPTYPGLRCALPSPREIARRIDAGAAGCDPHRDRGDDRPPGAALLPRRGIPFTTSYTTRFPEYIAARLPIPAAWSYAVLRRFHAAATVTMVSTPSLIAELTERGFEHLGLWTRGVDTDQFKPERAIDLDLPRPIFVCVGRIAIEKNLEAFLSLDLPGSKIVIGQGPQERELRRRFPDAKFMGLLDEKVLPAYLAGSDVFVFPSRTDTFGVVQLEALACGVPVAAYPVTGPKDVIGGDPVGVLHEDLRAACMGALHVSRQSCRTFALARSWETSARQFLGHVNRVVIDRWLEPHAA